MEVFTQRNFVADFFRQKLNFTGKNSKIAFSCDPLGDFEVTYMVRLWHDRLPISTNWTFFRQLSRLRHCVRILVKIVVFERGWITSSANFSGKEGLPPLTTVWPSIRANYCQWCSTWEWRRLGSHGSRGIPMGILSAMGWEWDGNKN